MQKSTSFKYSPFPVAITRWGERCERSFSHLVWFSSMMRSQMACMYQR